MAIDLYVCRKCKGASKLARQVGTRLEGRPGGDEVAVHLVRCQDICSGAVAGLEVDGRPVWFRRLRGKGDAKALARLARRGGAGPVPDRLAAHRVARRDGRPVRGRASRGR